MKFTLNTTPNTRHVTMSVDPTTGTFVQTIKHDVNSFLSDLIWNSAAMWGLSQTGLANWIYSMGPYMRGEVAEALRGALVIGAASVLRKVLIRYKFPVDDLMLVRF